MCSRRSTRGSGVVKHVASRALVRLRMPATEKADGRAAATRRGVVHHRIEATAGEQAKRPVGGAARQPLHVRAYLQPPFLLHLPLPRPASPPPAAPARPWPPPPPPPPSPPISPSPSPVPRAIRLPPTARCSVLRCSTPHGVLARSTDPPGALSTGGEGTSSPSLPAASLPKPPRRAAARRYRWIY